MQENNREGHIVCILGLCALAGLSILIYAAFGGRF